MTGSKLVTTQEATMHMIQTPVATITLMDGRRLDLQALPQVLEQYGYVRSSMGPIQWILPESEHAPHIQVGLTFSDDGSAIKLYSRCQQNVANVNFIAATAGWVACACYAVDASVELLVLEQFAHVRPVRLQIAGEAPLDLTQSAAGPRDVAISAPGSPTTGNSIADELAHVNRRLEALTAALEQSQRVLATHTTTELDVAFARQVESLAGLSSLRETPVARLLKAQGYDVALRVVRTR
jgi:hypothetical protein